MAATIKSPALGQRGQLGLEEVLAELMLDGRLSVADARQLRKRSPSSHNALELHPLVRIAKAKVADRHQAGRPLGLEVLSQWLADKAGVEYLKIDPMKIDVALVTQTVSHDYARRHRVLPVEANSEQLVFASSEPFATQWAKDLSQILHRTIRIVVANPVDIHRYLAEFYGVQRSVQLALDSKAGATSSALLNFEQLVELGKTGEIGADDRHVVHIVDWLLQYAFEQRASDIHLEPRREAGHMRFRIDGVLHKVFELPGSVMNAVTARIKILSRLDVAEKRRPQDGRIKTRSAEGREVELRISTMPTAFGEKVVMRIFDPDIVVKAFGQLGFNAKEEALWRDMIEHPHGIVLVTGPTGSGKTTTLYSTLKYLARPELNVCTVEDPIEMVAPEFNQMQIQPAVGLDFANGVRTLLRQDPDIIMVGEIRDLDTAQMTIQAALTGHLVLSTLHTNDAPSAVTRLLDLGVPHYLIQSTMTGVVAQRLLRTLCPHCKAPGELDQAGWNALTADFDSSPPPTNYVAVGCLECRHTGYLGRTGVYEMLPLSSNLRALIGPEYSSAKLRDTALREGMHPLRLSAADAIRRGLTTISEGLSVVPVY